MNGNPCATARWLRKDPRNVAIFEEALLEEGDATTHEIFSDVNLLFFLNTLLCDSDEGEEPDERVITRVLSWILGRAVLRRS